MEQKKIQWQGENRRKAPREKDLFYQLIVGINIFGWLLFVAALVVFHYARPELVTGVQAFWGVDGRRHWASGLSFYLITLLAFCVSLSLAVLLMKKRRNRRKQDHFGIGGIALLLVAGFSLALIYMDMQ